MAATITAYDAVLLRKYAAKQVQEQLFQNTATLSRIEKTDRYNIGQVARVPLHVSRNGGWTALPDGGGTLNTAGNQGLQKNDYTYGHFHQQIALQEDVIRQTSGNANAIVEAVSFEVDGAVNDMRRQLQRMLFGDQTGRIAQCRATATNNVDLNATANGGYLTGLNAINRGWIFVGQTVSVGAQATPAGTVASGTVTAVDKANVAFTHSSGAVTTEGTTDFVFSTGSGGSTSAEMNGLINLTAASGAFGTLTTATEPTWAGVTDSTSQALTLSLMLQQDQAIHQTTGSPSDVLITGLRQRRKLYEQLQLQVRYSSDSIGVGNPEGPSWNDHTTIITDPDCADTDVYFGQMKTLFLVADSKGPFWQNEISGGNTLAWIQATASYGAKLGYHVNFATSRRNAWTRLSGLT